MAASSSAATTASYNNTAAAHRMESGTATAPLGSCNSLDDLVDSAQAVLAARGELERLNEAVKGTKNEARTGSTILILRIILLERSSYGSCFAYWRPPGQWSRGFLVSEFLCRTCLVTLFIAEDPLGGGRTGSQWKMRLHRRRLSTEAKVFICVLGLGMLFLEGLR